MSEHQYPKTADEYFDQMQPETRAEMEGVLRELVWSWATATAMVIQKDGMRILHVQERLARKIGTPMTKAALEVWVSPSLKTSTEG